VKLKVIFEGIPIHLGLLLIWNMFENKIACTGCLLYW
jgi:hypothetical protein